MAYTERMLSFLNKGTEASLEFEKVAFFAVHNSYGDWKDMYL